MDIHSIFSPEMIIDHRRNCNFIFESILWMMGGKCTSLFSFYSLFTGLYISQELEQESSLKKRIYLGCASLHFPTIKGEFQIVIPTSITLSGGIYTFKSVYSARVLFCSIYFRLRSSLCGL